MGYTKDLASALEVVSSKLRGGQVGGTIRDTNGNTVGKYEIVED